MGSSCFRLLGCGAPLGLFPSSWGGSVGRKSGVGVAASVPAPLSPLLLGGLVSRLLLLGYALLAGVKGPPQTRVIVRSLV